MSLTALLSQNQKYCLQASYHILTLILSISSLPSSSGVGGGFAWLCDDTLKQWGSRERNWEIKIEELALKVLLQKAQSTVRNLKRVKEKKGAAKSLWSSHEWTIKNPWETTFDGVKTTQATLGLQLENEDTTTNTEFEKITQGEDHLCQLYEQWCPGKGGVAV